MLLQNLHSGIIVLYAIGGDFFLKRIICCFLLFILLTSFNSCTFSQKEQSASKQIFALDTVITLTVWGNDSQGAIDDVEKLIYEYENMFSTTVQTSDISKINTSTESEVQVSDKTAGLISRSLSISELTNGDFDITIYPLVKLWGFTTDEYRVPDSDEIKAALSFVDYKNISVSENIVKKKSNTQIDLGAIAKGYISSQIIDEIKKYDVCGAVVNLGGNVQCFGTKEYGDTSFGGYSVGVEYPESGDCYAILNIGDKAAITSGAYQRNFIQNGKTYHHIIDPKTGCPAQSDILSVTVVSEDAVLADALSTALFIMGVQEATDFLKEQKCADVIMLSDDTVYISKGISDNVELEKEYNHLKKQII